MDDSVNRQAAIDELKRQWAGKAAIDVIRNLPSAQPEIIRCKDCKWWERSLNSPYGYCNAMKHIYMSAHWEIRMIRRYKGDFYCADAERSEDGGEDGDEYH